MKGADVHVGDGSGSKSESVKHHEAEAVEGEGPRGTRNRGNLISQSSDAQGYAACLL